MSKELHIDFETFSVADLPDVGQYVYFDDKSTGVWCAAYAFDGEEPKLWLPGEPCPKEISDHVTYGGTICAYNASFERIAWRKILHPKHNWPLPKDSQFRCVLAEAFAMSLPGKLEKAAPALGLDTVKDDKGHRVMLQLCRPRKINDDGSTTWWDTPEKLQILYDYCKQDVRTEMAVGARLMRLRQSEVEVYSLNAKMNDMGVYIDENLCLSAQSVVDKSMKRLNAEMKEVTGGAVVSCSATGQLVAYLNANGVETDSVDKDHVETLLIRDDLPAPCYRAVELRQLGGKSGVAKLNKMLSRRQSDGRMRGNTQYHGASTGRFSARGAQLQNLTQPTMLKNDDHTELARMVDNAIDLVQEGDINLIELLYGNPMELVSDCVRPVICAPPKRILYASDFSNIEGRGIPWLAGQQDKLDAFRAADNGTGPEIYLMSAAGIYNIPIMQAKPFRPVGKTAELSLGYEGGPRAIAKMAKKFRVKLAPLYGSLHDRASDYDREMVAKAWLSRGVKTGMEEKAWSAAEFIKIAWRQKHPKIVQYWKDINGTAIKAVEDPTKIFSCGYTKFRKAGSFLFCQLPSGRAICYPYPRLKEIETPWGEKRNTLIYKDENAITKKWGDKAYYGGLGAENITQAVARDIMAEAMLRIDKAGYDVVLTVHDEVVSEVPEGFGSMEEYNSLMVQQPTWAPGFPITASGWRGYRYRK